MKKIIHSSIIFSLIVFTFLFCGKEILKTDTDNTDKDNNNKKSDIFKEDFKQTGWISETRYRAVIYIFTFDECRSSTREQIEEKIKFEAIKQLQYELNGTINRNRYPKIKNLVDNYGILKPDVIECSENNIFYFDIEKNDLKLEFQNIKNIK